MRKILLFILLFCSLCSPGQNPASLHLVYSPSFYRDPATSYLWIYQDTTYQWSMLATKVNIDSLGAIREPSIAGGLSTQYWDGTKTWHLFPTSLPASDVYSWAKVSVKPTYVWSEIGSKPTNLSSFTNDLGNYGGWATINSPTFTGTVSGISPTMVGLENVTNNAQWYSGNHPTTLSGYGITDTPWTSMGYLTGITGMQVTGALGFTPYNATNPNGYISSITSGNVTTALGYTPYNSTNPSGYISSISGALLASGATMGATSQSQVFTNGVTLSNLTAGSIPFAGTSGVINQDNFNLFWDNTNKRQGIGTLSPIYKLDVRGLTFADGIRSAMGFDIYQVPDPTVPTGVISSGGSVNTGAHWYGITYTTSTGETHIVYSAAQITTTSGNNSVTLTIPVSADPRVTGRKIYRTKAGTQNYTEYLLATIANNTATSYVDIIGDDSLTGGSGVAYFRTNTTSNNITINGVKCLTLDLLFTGIGYNAGASLTTGGRNTLIGTNAGLGITSFSDNTTVGYSSGISITGPSNTAMGSYALNGSATNYNSCLGAFSLLANTGSSNSSFGYHSGSASSSGNANLYFGFYAGHYETGSNKLIIDAIDRNNESLSRSSALIYGVTNSTIANQTLSLGGGGIVSINGSLSNLTMLQQSLSYSSSVTINYTLGSDANISALTGNVALVFSNLMSGARGEVELIQDGSGSRHLTGISSSGYTVKYKGGISTLSTAPNTTDLIKYTVKGTVILIDLNLNYQ